MPRLTDPDQQSDSLAGLVRRLLEDGKAYARAEIALAKAVAKHRAAKAKTGAVLIGVGVTLLFGAFLALVLALVLGLATLIGPFGAGMAVFAVLGLVGGLLAMAGAKGLAALGGSEEERAALAGEEDML